MANVWRMHVYIISSSEAWANNHMIMITYSTLSSASIKYIMLCQNQRYMLRNKLLNEKKSSPLNVVEYGCEWSGVGYFKQ